MPTSTTNYRIFLASPGDVIEDRNSIDNVINELNLTFGREKGIRLELVKWETNTAPAATTSYTQKIINDDIGNDYDLFIGLLWSRFGTETPNANSGTEEEFNNAYNRFLEDPASLQILFYFKNASIPISDINPDQISKIQEFKSKLTKDILFWEYNDINELNQFLRIHITKHVLKLHENHLNSNSNKEKDDEIVNKTQVEESNDKLGVLEYDDMAYEYFSDSTQSLNNISDATDWVSDQFDRKTEEITAMTKIAPERKALKEIFKRTAKIMDNYGNRISPEIPIFYENFEKGIGAFSKLMAISRDDLDMDEEQFSEVNESLNSLIIGIDSSIINMRSFSKSLEELPRVSKEIVRAKTSLLDKINSLIDKLVICSSIASETQKSILKNNVPI